MADIFVIGSVASTEPEGWVQLAKQIEEYLKRKLPEWRDKHPGVEEMNVAVMGCIVNGPGEMADADFGYVGSRPGKIDLYVGKTCVEKNIDFEDADFRLIELIKSHGRWVEKPELISL